MGDPRKLRKKYSTPTHPWQRTRILEEVDLMKGYGYRRKTEIWKIRSELGRFRKQARKLISLRTKQAEIEKKQLVTKLHKLGLIPKEASMEDVLGLTTKEISERRLQTLVHKNKIASSLSQARQFITHKHIHIGNKVITSPNYLVSTDEEKSITFNPISPFSNKNHPLINEMQEKERKEKVLVSEEEELKEKPKEKKQDKEKEQKSEKSEEKIKGEVAK